MPMRRRRLQRPSKHDGSAGHQKPAPRRGPEQSRHFDEATANPYKDSMPDVLTMKDGTKVTRAEQWPKRRAEILEDFEREVYGRIPKNVPKVTWEVTETTEGESGGIPTVTKTLVGHVDNSAFPRFTVDIQASFTVPANAQRRFRSWSPLAVLAVGGPPPAPTCVPWTQQAIAKAGATARSIPAAFSPTTTKLRAGIIGLTNKGQPRKPDRLGRLRAWQWGVSRLIDYFEANPDSKVDAKKVGIEGLVALRQGGHRHRSVRRARRGRPDRFVGRRRRQTVSPHLWRSRREPGRRRILLDGRQLHEVRRRRGRLRCEDGRRPAGRFARADRAVPPALLHQLRHRREGAIPNGSMPTAASWPACWRGRSTGCSGKKDFGTPGDYLTDPMPPVGH